MVATRLFLPAALVLTLLIGPLGLAVGSFAILCDVAVAKDWTATKLLFYALLAIGGSFWMYL